MAWSNGNSFNSLGYTPAEIERMKEEAMDRAREMDRAASRRFEEEANGYRTAPQTQARRYNYIEYEDRPGLNSRRRQVPVSEPAQSAPSEAEENTGLNASAPRSNRAHGGSVASSNTNGTGTQMTPHQGGRSVPAPADHTVSIPFLKDLHIDSDILLLGGIAYLILREGGDKSLLMALAYIMM